MNDNFRSATNFVLSCYIVYSNMKECNSTEIFNIYLYSSFPFSCPLLSKMLFLI
jgi:hypothetical protein